MSLVLALGMSAQNKDTGLKFDGVDDHVVIPHHSSLNLGRSPFTIEAIIQADTGNNGTLAPMILSKKKDGSASTDGYLFGLDDKGKIAIQLEGQSFNPSPFGGWGQPGVTAADLRDGQCHHIAWTRETNGVSDTLNGYQDGAYVKKTRQAAGQLDVQCDHDLWIGWSDFNKVADIYQFQGIIKEIRVWNYAKTESEIYNNRYKHMKGNETGLLLYWRLDENGGSIVHDCGPSGNDGTIMNGATWATWCNFMDAIPSPNACYSGGPSGIDAVSSTSNIGIYPNPVHQTFRLSGLKDQQVDAISVYEMTGRRVLATVWNGVGDFDLSHLNSGIYIVELSLDGKVLSRQRISKN